MLPLVNWELFANLDENLLQANASLNSSRRNSIIYKVDEQFFVFYYSLLTFLQFDYHVFSKFTKYLHIPLLISWELF